MAPTVCTTQDNRHPSILEVQEWFEKPLTCYLTAPVQFEPRFQIGPDCYVGSTILRLHKRQDTRIRQLRQLLVMQPVHAELMLYWQVSRQKFSLVVLTTPNSHLADDADSEMESISQFYLHFVEANLQGRPWLFFRRP